MRRRPEFEVWRVDDRGYRTSREAVERGEQEVNEINRTWFRGADASSMSSVPGETGSFATGIARAVTAVTADNRNEPHRSAARSVAVTAAGVAVSLAVAVTSVVEDSPIGMAVSAVLLVLPAISAARSGAEALRSHAGEDAAPEGTAAASGELLRQWKLLLSEQHALEQRWLAYEKDLGLLLEFPVMRDMSDPLVQTVVRSMVAAARLRTGTPPDGASSAADTDLAGAVSDFRAALDAAESHARKLRQSRFSDTERRSLRRAQALLSRAFDEHNFPAERRSSYKQAVQLLEGLIDVPEAAVAAAVTANPVLAIGAAG